MRYTAADLRAVQDHFGFLRPGPIEKDWHVVRALAAIAAADTTPFQLVFGGGTALSRAHGLLRRMSEDIDLKIVGDEAPRRQALRRLRDTITEVLLAAGFRFDPANRAHRDSRNESRYTIYRIPYAPLSAEEETLRPEIQIEIAVWPLRRPAVALPVSSFVAEAFQRPPEVASIACVAITQTAAEKFVALTRRTAAEVATGGPRDPTLVRHIYDLHVIRAHYDTAEVAALAREIMPHDAAVFGNQFPAYRANPMAETLRAIEALAADPSYAQHYTEFCRLMVYGETAEYVACMETLGALTAQLPKGDQ